MIHNMNQKIFLLFLVFIIIGGVLLFLNNSTIKNNTSVLKEEFRAGDAILKTGEDAFAISYTHTVPGEYSEIFVTARSFPGDEIKLELSGPNNEINTKTLLADENGVAYFTFRIYEFGTYSARTTYNIGETTHLQSITVE